MAKEDKVTEQETDLVQLEKNGDIISAHPDQVALWTQQGWSVTE